MSIHAKDYYNCFMNEVINVIWIFRPFNYCIIVYVKVNKYIMKGQEENTPTQKFQIDTLKFFFEDYYQGIIIFAIIKKITRAEEK